GLIGHLCVATLWRCHLSSSAARAIAGCGRSNARDRKCGGCGGIKRPPRRTFGGQLRFMWTIFGGAKPGELPWPFPTKYHLVINLKAAKALGLDVSTQFQQRADEIIE